MDHKTEILKLAEVDPERARHLAQSLHRKKDDIDLMRKAVIVDAIVDTADERAITARVSTPDRDRDGEIVDPKGIDITHYNANPVLLWAHQYATPPIGRAMWSRVDDKGLLCKFQFANTEFADEIYMLYRDGFLKTFSIGFIPVEFDGKEKIHKRTSLLEVSAVPVPSNPMAVVEMTAKGITICDQLKKDLGMAIMPDEQGPEDNLILPEEEIKIVPVTKPETTDNYHRIPVSEGHGGHEIRTIDITAGVKALYCVPCKVVKTYLFDVDKFTMEQARAWVDAHKDDKVAEVTETKIAEPPVADSAPVVPVADITELFTQLNARLDALEARIVPAQEPAAPAPVDEIVLDPSPVAEDIDISAIPAPAKLAHAHNHVTPDAELTEAQVVDAVTKAIARLDLKAVIKDSVELSLDKMRGRVR